MRGGADLKPGLDTCNRQHSGLEESFGMCLKGYCISYGKINNFYHKSYLDMEV